MSLTRAAPIAAIGRFTQCVLAVEPGFDAGDGARTW